MLSILSNINPAIPLTLFLLALLGLRFRVNPRTSLWVNTSPEKLFALVDVHDGKRENWGRTVTHIEYVDHGKGIYRKTYETSLTTGTVQTSQALFSIAKCEAPNLLDIKREGLEGLSLNNELLSQTYSITPENGGSRLQVAYAWGPRPLLAQLLARADLWGGAFRLKGLAETGVPSEWQYQLISLGIALFTGLLTFAGFTTMMNLTTAALIIGALFIHEFGHLLAYRLMGQPWGKMVFLPFLGAIAMPRLPYATQGQAVFAALMGPGFSILPAIVCALPSFLWDEIRPLTLVCGTIMVLLNLFNLLPVEPLDGGVALRSVLAKLFGKNARFGLMAVGTVFVTVGILMSQLILAIFGGISILANLRVRSIDAGLTPLSSLQVTISFFSYVALFTAYVTLLRYFYSLSLLFTSR